MKENKRNHSKIAWDSVNRRKNFLRSAKQIQQKKLNLNKKKVQKQNVKRE